jgi:hypothetical protein
MSDEVENGPGEETTDEIVDEHTTEPQSDKPEGGWQMPKPVFRQTSGYLPQGFAKPFDSGAAAVETPASEAVPDPAPEMAGVVEAPAPPAPAAVDARNIEPQPDMSDEFDYGHPEPIVGAAAAEVTTTARTGSGRILKVNLVLVFVLAVVAVLLGIAIYFFWPQLVDGSFE